MKKSFLFVWHETPKYANRTPIERHNLISLANARGDLGTDAKNAMDIFCKQFGNLKKNTIVCIQELDENGNAVGEPITPMENTNMVPLKHA